MINGTSDLAKFINQHLDLIVDEKVNMGEGRFLYFDEEGTSHIGSVSQYGHSSLVTLGGKSKNKNAAISELQNIVDTEPIEFRNQSEKLKSLIK